ncbi:fimbrial protein [Citrobacter sp. RHBSTW-00671]|uniref:fimbrial protein n=1 Tax=Citrobacter sp. RHBSTW-00671 TaxID=2742660 RepID=UPI0017DD4120|nr:fimbrial protein [Citrobacter sp. RHBSTW-00671]MBA7966119.1 type 1 fimbrial protein [Citrobacter sp. RHBSTW-00671]HCJ6373309.1 type 1 fimbrial protein [Citrobacter freundii]
MRKGIPLLLLLMIFGQKSLAADFSVSGNIFKKTCTLQTGDGTSIALTEVSTQTLSDSTTLVSAKEFIINVDCSSPMSGWPIWDEVTGKFTTNGEVDNNVKALKNTIVDASGAKNVGLQIKDKTTGAIVDFSTTQQFTLSLGDNDSALFRFEVGYISLGEPGKGDVHAAATFTLTYA